MSFSFEKLLVYHKAIHFPDEVCARTERFQREYGFLVEQLNRAALSISANIAEGNGHFTKADRRNSSESRAVQSRSVFRSWNWPDVAADCLPRNTQDSRSVLFPGHLVPCARSTSKWYRCDFTCCYLLCVG